MEDIFATAPVALSVAIVQMVKLTDASDKLSKFYSLIAIFVGLAVGILFSTRADWQTMIVDGIQNAAYASLAWAAKKAVLDPFSIKLPGDPKN